MSASEHVNRTLFHGTAHVFGEGETIDPQVNSNNGNMMGMYLENNKPHAYVTSSKDSAERYAGIAADWHGTLFAPVYEVEDNPDIHSAVETLQKHGYDEKTTKHPNIRNMYYSEKSIKPKKVASWVVNPNINSSYDSF